VDFFQRRSYERCDRRPNLAVEAGEKAKIFTGIFNNRAANNRGDRLSGHSGCVDCNGDEFSV